MTMLFLLLMLARDGDDEAKSALDRLVESNDKMKSMVEALDKMLDLKWFVPRVVKAV